MRMRLTVEHHNLMKEEKGKKKKKRYKEQGSSLGDDLFKASQRQTPRELHNSQQKMYSMLCNKHGKKEDI